MFKWIGVIITIVALAIAGYWGYTQFTQQMMRTKNPYDYFTPDTKIAFEIQDLQNLSEQISTTNLMWEGVKNWPALSQALNFTEFSSAYEEMNVYGFYSDAEGWLFVAQFPDLNSNKAVLTYLTSLKTPEGISISTTSETLTYNKQTYYYRLDHGSILFSGSKEHLTSAIAHSAHPVTKPEFTKVLQTTSDNIAVKLLYQSEAQNTVSSYLMANWNVAKALPINWGTWTALDIDITPSDLTLRGYTYASDSTEKLAGNFSDQQPTSHTIIPYLPASTAYFKRYGFTDFASFYQRMLAQELVDSTVAEDIYYIDTNYAFDINSQILPFIDNEIVFAEINQPYNVEETEKMIWMGVSDASLIMDRLASLSLSTSKNITSPYQIVTYKNSKIYPIYEPRFLTCLVGKAAFSNPATYASQINDFVVFTESPATLQYAIDKIEREQTMATNENYLTYEKQSNKTSNYYVYFNPSKYQNRMTHKLSKKGADLISNDLLNQYQSYGIQMSQEKNNLYYISLYTSHNPVSKEASNSLWELALDTISNFKPFIFTNHYTKAKEIVIQDELHNLYLINNKGQVLWKKRLPAPIISDIQTVDILNNNKLQLVFNTANQLYILDRNGNNLDGFPLTFNSTIVKGVTIVDYEKNHNYRFIAALTNGEILNINKNGKRVQGWEYSNNKLALAHPIVYGRIKNRDYLIAVYTNGKIVALNRRGQVRLNFKSSFTTSPVGDIFVRVQNHISSSYVVGMTENSELEQISFNGNKTKIGKYPNNWHQFYDTDHDGSIELVYTKGKNIKSVAFDGHQTLAFTARDSLAVPLTLFNLGEYSLIGYRDLRGSKIYLSRTNGELLNDFPLLGSSLFSLFDINRDGRYNILTTDSNAVLKAYNIEL